MMRTVSITGTRKPAHQWPLGPRAVCTRSMHVILPLAAATILGGCAVGPDYQTPFLPMPASWSRTEGTTSSKPPELSRWWARLRDPLLNQLIDEAVDGNLDVAAAEARIREARASYRQAVGALFPTVMNRDSVIRSKGSVFSASTNPVPGAGMSPIAGLNSPSTTYQTGFDASWELDLFGANRRAVEAAAYGMDASEENLRATLLTLIGDIASNYVQARGYQARIALARRTAASQDETTHITRNRFAAGTASAADLANATGQAATMRAAIAALEISYAEAVHRLSVLIGQAPAALDTCLANPAAIPPPRLPISTGIPAVVLLTRPDVRFAEHQYAQYTARIGQAAAALYPSVSLSGNIATASTQLGDLGRNSSISWSFGPTLSIPIFNAGKLQAAVEIAQAQRDVHFVAYRSSVLTALREVEDALVSLGKERARNRALAASATAYRQSATLSQSLYKAGSSSFLDVLIAERSLYSAEDALIQSEVLITTHYIALNKALGGGWDGFVDVARPEVADRNTGPHVPQMD
jgi:outer membrane protein, multidrug efflux system